MRTQTLAAAIAAAHSTIANMDDINHPWLPVWEARLKRYADLLPSGAGIDCGTKIDDRTAADKVVLTCSYHHMNENGMYDGWTKHTITCRPTFDGIDIKISGRDRNQIKDYLGDVFHQVLSEPAPDVSDLKPETPQED